MKASLSYLLLPMLLLAGCATKPGATRVPHVADAVSPVPGVVSAGRLTHSDIERVRSAGIRHVIDLTPDDETPDFDEAAAVRAAGLAYTNLPVRGAADLTLETVKTFDAMLRAARRPVLVHCASGNRVGAVAALRARWVDGLPTEEAIEIGKAWGLKGLESSVRQRIEAANVAAGGS